MRKGKNQLTKGDYRESNERLKRENAALRRERDKLQHDYDSLKAAHNKLLKEVEASKRQQPAGPLVNGSPWWR